MCSLPYAMCSVTVGSIPSPCILTLTKPPYCRLTARLQRQRFNQERQVPPGSIYDAYDAPITSHHYSIITVLVEITTNDLVYGLILATDSPGVRSSTIYNNTLQVGAGSGTSVYNPVYLTRSALTNPEVSPPISCPSAHLGLHATSRRSRIYPGF
jgi:hypothetical protein